MKQQQQPEEAAPEGATADNSLAGAPNWVAELAKKNQKANSATADEEEKRLRRLQEIEQAYNDAKRAEGEQAPDPQSSSLADMPEPATASVSKNSAAKKSGRSGSQSARGSQSSRGASPRRPTPPPPTRIIETVDSNGNLIDDYMRRADYGRLIQMDANVQQANQVRWERMQIKRQQQEQREAFRQRGVRLRGERLKTEKAIADSVDAVRQNAALLGDNQRLSNQAMREKRAIQESQWVRHGRELTEKYSTRGNQALVRQLKKEVADQRMAEATVMRNFLKKAKQQTDDSIREVNRDRVERVYAETAHDVIRLSKQTTVAGRWDRADNVRKHKSLWKKALEQNEDEYMKRAMDIHAATTAPTDAAALAQKRHEERTEYARKMTQWRKDIKAQREAVAADVRASKRNVRDSVEYGQLIPRHDVERDVATSVLSVDQRSMSPRIEPDDPLGRLTRFFGFKSSWKLVPDESVVVHV